MRTAVALLLAVGLSVAAPVPKSLKKHDDARLLNGRWVRVSLDVGEGASPDPSRWVVVRDGKMLSGGTDIQDIGENAFTLDPSQSPKTLDVNWANKSVTTRYIYELDGDTLRWCHAEEERPAEFKGGDGRFCVVWKRVKE
jgi:uncharacterized protein (TIGR03067 family)